MYSTEDILSLLREGNSLDAIVSDFTDALNKANETYEAEKAASKEYETKLNTLADALYDLVIYMFPKYKENISKEEISTLTQEVVNEAKSAIDSLLSVDSNSLDALVDKLLFN